VQPANLLRWGVLISACVSTHHDNSHEFHTQVVAVLKNKLVISPRAHFERLSQSIAKVCTIHNFTSLSCKTESLIADIAKIVESIRFERNYLLQIFKQNSVLLSRTIVDIAKIVASIRYYRNCFLRNFKTKFSALEPHRSCTAALCEGSVDGVSTNGQIRNYIVSDCNVTA